MQRRPYTPAARREIRMSPITFRIRLTDGTLWEVSGWALDLPSPLDWVRVCAHQHYDDEWVLTHYDSGLRIFGPDRTASIWGLRPNQLRRLRWNEQTRDDLAQSAWRWLLYLHRRGVLRPALSLASRGATTEALRDIVQRALCEARRSRDPQGR